MEFNNKNIQKIKLNCEKISKKDTSARNTLERIIKKTNCYSCSIYYKELDMKFDQKYRNCNCSKAANVIKAYKEVLHTEKEYWDYYYNTYAKAIFDELCKIKPCIKDLNANVVYSWDEFFGNNFNDLENNKRKCLVFFYEGKKFKYALV